MKRYLAISLLALALASCKSDTNELPNNQPVLLLGYQAFNGTSSEQIALDYDADNRITRVSRLTPSQPPVTIYDISYAGNEITLTRPFTNNDSITLQESIVLTVDGDKLVKRVERSFFEFKAPTSLPQRSYIYDSIGYTYSGELRESAGGVHYDSTWFNPGTEQILRDTQYITHSFVNNGGNLSSSNRLIQYVSTKEESGNTVVTKRSLEEAMTYGYSSSYLNKTDFLNQVILQELNVFNFGLINSAYTNIPDQLSTSLTDRDELGNVISTSSATYNRVISYNAEGYLETITDAANPQIKTTYFYNR